MDLTQSIAISEGNTTVRLPIVNLLRLTSVYMNKFLEEYRKNHDTHVITEFYDWVIHEKLGVSRDGGKILL